MFVNSVSVNSAKNESFRYGNIKTNENLCWGGFLEDSSTADYLIWKECVSRTAGKIFFRDGNFSGECSSDRVRPGKPDRERGRKP